MAFFMVTPEDEAAAGDVVSQLLRDTKCLAEVRGADMPELTLRIAGGICRARARQRKASPWPEGQFVVKSGDVFLCSIERVSFDSLGCRTLLFGSEEEAMAAGRAVVKHDAIDCIVAKLAVGFLIEEARAVVGGP